MQKRIKLTGVARPHTAASQKDELRRSVAAYRKSKIKDKSCHVQYDRRYQPTYKAVLRW
jgi:hypothetical protein